MVMSPRIFQADKFLPFDAAYVPKMMHRHGLEEGDSGSYLVPDSLRVTGSPNRCVKSLFESSTYHHFLNFALKS